MTFSEAGENDAASGDTELDSGAPRESTRDATGVHTQAATPAPLDITALRAKWAKYDFAAVDALAEGK